jgi:hypothetical protein
MAKAAKTAIKSKDAKRHWGKNWTNDQAILSHNATLKTDRTKISEEF